MDERGYLMYLLTPFTRPFRQIIHSVNLAKGLPPLRRSYLTDELRKYQARVNMAPQLDGYFKKVVRSPPSYMDLPSFVINHL